MQTCRAGGSPPGEDDIERLPAPTDGGRKTPSHDGIPRADLVNPAAADLPGKRTAKSGANRCRSPAAAARHPPLMGISQAEPVNRRWQNALEKQEGGGKGKKAKGEGTLPPPSTNGFLQRRRGEMDGRQSIC
jgi:hypothetical protein